jgi:hypothetical protein
MRCALLTALAACTASTSPESGCDTTVPGLGEVRVSIVDCGDLKVEGGEGGRGDILVANSKLRATLRHPLDSQTLVGVGGGTLVDIGPWGIDDAVHEIAPLIDGGWLDVQAMVLEDDGIRLTGEVADLPDRPTPSAGQSAEVRWTIVPDSNWLQLTGSDGLWMHVSGATSVLDGWMWQQQIVYGHNGASVEDLGGALRIDGADRLFVGTPEQAIAAMITEDGVHLSGIAEGAERLALLSEGRPIARMALPADGVFDLDIPDRVDAVRAEAAGHRPSDTAAPNTGLQLLLGGAGTVEINATWDQRSRPFSVAWQAEDGRAGTWVLPAEGGPLALGEGAHGLVLDAGPAWHPLVVDLVLGPDEVATLDIELTPRFDPDVHVLAATDWLANRSRTWRGNNTHSAWLASTAGIDWIAYTPEDEVSDVTGAADNFPNIAHRNASHTTGPGWSIWSWPWDASTRSGHGAVDIDGLAVEDVLAATVGGPARDRYAVVDLGWLAQAPAPWAVDPLPSFVALSAPGTDGPTAWGPWFDWLDARVDLPPGGPLVWAPVADPLLVGGIDIEQALTSGLGVATTGPLVQLQVDGAHPGDILAEANGDSDVVATVTLLGAHDVDHLALVGTGGEVLFEWDLVWGDQVTLATTVRTSTWLIAVAWNDGGTAFAATGPVWVGQP